MNVEIQNVTFGDTEAPLDDVKSLVENMNLDYNLLLKRPHELSGGQLQRVSIVRAMLMKNLDS